jgi:hypothetical protein
MLKGFTVPKSPFGQAALTPPHPGTMPGMLLESSSGRTLTPQRRRYRKVFPEIRSQTVTPS